MPRFPARFGERAHGRAGRGCRTQAARTAAARASPGSTQNRPSTRLAAGASKAGVSVEKPARPEAREGGRAAGRRSRTPRPGAPGRRSPERLGRGAAPCRPAPAGDGDRRSRRPPKRPGWDLDLPDGARAGWPTPRGRPPGRPCRRRCKRPAPTTPPR